MREKYESLALADLRAIAKNRGIKGTSGLKKAQLVELMLAEDEKDKAAGKDVEPRPVLRAPGRTPRREIPHRTGQRYGCKRHSGSHAGRIWFYPL